MSKYQHFHDLAAGQYERLKADIKARGILLPILVDEAGKTIDGHQRRQVAAELGIECPSVTVEGLTEEEKHWRRVLTPTGPRWNGTASSVNPSGVCGSGPHRGTVRRSGARRSRGAPRSRCNAASWPRGFTPRARVTRTGCRWSGDDD